MAEEMKCPGNELETILMALNPLFKEDDSSEPDRKVIEEIEGDKNPNISEKEIDRAYREHLWIYHQHQKYSKRIMETISKYGEGEKEIEERLKIHFNKCKKCRQFYLKQLDEVAESLIEMSESFLGKPEKSYLELIRESDFLRYLNH